MLGPRRCNWRLTYARHSVMKAGFFGGALGFAALFFASGIPRIQEDILKVRNLPGRLIRHSVSVAGL